jgi:sulfate adenylyltransferase subunit 1 (EFTu-like GTPase family)
VLPEQLLADRSLLAMKSLFFLRRKPAKIGQISTFDGDLQSAEDGKAVTLVLEPDVDATRGDVIELAAKATPLLIDLQQL